MIIDDISLTSVRTFSNSEFVISSNLILQNYHHNDLNKYLRDRKKAILLIDLSYENMWVCFFHFDRIIILAVSNEYIESFQVSHLMSCSPFLPFRL